MRDTEGAYEALPFNDRDHGGRWFLQKAVPGQTFMNLTFQAPPDTVKQVDVIIPWFAPLAAVQISGEGGSASAGSDVTGKALDMQGALRDLHAEVVGQQIKVNLAADLLFDFDKADIRPGAEPTLDKVVTLLKASPGATLSVDGHTDGKGTDAYNLPLSAKRAANVAQWLSSRANLPAASVRTKGWGKSKPVAPDTKPDGSDDPDGRAKNRRVEITVTRP
jgi:outer membrane protein OmpA-like peptidoglycan-associated protein